MSKLQMVRLYKADEVPEHILQEVLDLVSEMSLILSPLMAGKNPNIILSAFARYHALMICYYVKDDHLETAAKTEAIGLLKNVEHISGQEFWKDGE